MINRIHQRAARHVEQHALIGATIVERLKVRLEVEGVIKGGSGPRRGGLFNEPESSQRLVVNDSRRN